MKINVIDGVLFKKALSGAAGLLEKNKEDVNSLNVFPVPDGDTGTNMSLTIKSALKQGLSVEENDASKIALAASQGSLMGARGNSGVILSQLFRGFASGLEGRADIDVKTLARGLKKASDTAYNAVMKPTEGTILTVARECGEFAMSISNEEDILIFLKKVIEHGNDTLNKTPDMLPVLKQAGVVDAGGKGYMYVLTGAYYALSGIENFEIDSREEQAKVEHDHKKSIDTDDIKFGYCTEFMINTKFTDSNVINSLRDDLCKQGDSLLVVGGDGIIKVHVHTNNPGLALEKGISLGALSDIKIDNMRYQHEEILLRDELSQLRNEDLESELEKKYSFVSVSIGEGVDQVFKDLNVDIIVSGGQTMNPSTEDIFKAIEKTKGENVFVLPNNKNIILAAEQTRELSKRNIIVLPTRSVPEGISALLAFDENASVDENIRNMNENIENVMTGQVTYAVRDTEVNNTKIEKGNIIGMSNGKILASGEEVNDVTLDLIQKMINDDISIITIFFGNNMEEERAEELGSALEEKFPDVDVEILYGGQPLYYYVFSLE
ncbi:DAK2 domain-containing protein [Wansuia hejianensis]|uniref:DAK2 domain-containing protein n=1 Tax=Wansuia hejianensis TaxID=2763667 RepID=A0A926EY27_9FIRM|nr:DAK2 domain-containing protein [Wansuia hejianensis]MBC8590468.1 DAK2 domain-containing protein [Wansuia hejianensis]